MSEPKPIRCEGWRRYGGAFSLGPMQWEQCPGAAVVMLTVKQEGYIKAWPACLECWAEAIDSGLKVRDVRLIGTGGQKAVQKPVR